jgi:hypothetical protein
MESGTIHGETLAVPERVIVAPAPGTFRPVQPGDIAAEIPVEQEQVIGFVEGKGHSTPVHSPFGGKLMGLLLDVVAPLVDLIVEMLHANEGVHAGDELRAVHGL